MQTGCSLAGGIQSPVHIKKIWESDFFGSFPVSVKRVVLGTGVIWCILLASISAVKNKKQFPKRDIFMWIFVFCMLFNGGMFRGMSQ